MKTYDLCGIWSCELDGEVKPIALPGTLDTSGIGHRDATAEAWHPDATKADGEYFTQSEAIATRFTRKVTQEGPAVIYKTVNYTPTPGKRVFLECERARHISLYVNGEAIPHVGTHSITTPHIFELTGKLSGDDEIKIVSDNSYPGWPREDIVYSSAATNETQTNWNGIVGYFRLREEDPVFISSVRVLPHGDTLDVGVTISAADAWHGRLTLTSEAIAENVSFDITTPAGNTEHVISSILLSDGVHRWDIDDGYLYELTATLDGGECKTVSFGVRDIGVSDGKLHLNRRPVFIRGEANCAVFPETGYPPMTESEWKAVLEIYRSYGVNCMRFHSHCPPEAAFAAADKLGIMMQPELSHWNPRCAFETDEMLNYYRAELLGMIGWLANHPSFVMLSLGNELQSSEEGHKRIRALLVVARALDPTRLYADGSNNHYGWYGSDEGSDFYTSSNYYEYPLRATNCTMKGWLNESYPDMRVNYEHTIAKMREKYSGPVFSFEVGQYEVLPDFDEIAEFRGVTEPANYKLIESRVKKSGQAFDWKKQVEATGELSLLCYRAEIEAAMRTESMSGISLLGLQDFPGQGTALVGMLNSHLSPKPFDFARPQRFERFFRDVLPLVLLPKFTYTSGETVEAEVKLHNYGKTALTGRMKYTVSGIGFNYVGDGEEVNAPCGTLTTVGTVSFPTSKVSSAVKLMLTVEFCGYTNEYAVWVYPDVTPHLPDDVYKCSFLDAEAERVLAGGGKVFISPPSTKEAMPNSIKAQFSTDFWSVGTFPAQEGGMGQLIDADHPIFRDFPTDTHTDWQWWAMATRRAVILPRAMKKSIIRELDSYAYLRPIAQLFECSCGGGKVVFSSIGLDDMQGYPECRALLAGIYRYMESDDFAPAEEMTKDELRALAVNDRQQ